MLKIAKSIEYSIIALRYINESHNGNCISAKEISESENIPFDLLAKILQKLVKAGIISSVQGNKGGYTLLRSAEDLSLLEITEAVGQRIRLTDCLFENATVADCGRMENCPIRNPLDRIQHKVLDLFNKTKLYEIIS